VNMNTKLAEMEPGTILSIAGVGYRDGIPAKEADIGWPMGVVRLPDGDLVFAEMRGHRIWRIDGEGILHTFAGDGVPEDSGDGGPAIDARVFTPHDLCLDNDGNVYFSQLGTRGPDLGPNVVRKIDRKTGIITRVAGSGRTGRNGLEGPALEADFDTTTGIAVDRDGNLYICGKWDSNVRRVDAKTGHIAMFAGQATRHHELEREGRAFSGGNYSFAGYHGDGGPASEAALGFPEHLAMDSRGDLYICDNGNHRIRKIEVATGTITTVLGTGAAASNGDGGPATEAAVNMPDAICIDAHDNLYVGEARGNRLRKVDARTGIVTTLAGNGIAGYEVDGLPGPESRCNPIESGIWADPDGTVFWSDSSGRLRRYDGETGIVTTAAGGTSIHDGPSMEAFLACPSGLDIGPDGHVYIADMQHDRIRALDMDSGTIRTVAGSGARALGGDNGPALDAGIYSPHDVAVDSQGEVVIADTHSASVRRVDGDGTIRSIGGVGLAGDDGDGGPAISAAFTRVEAVAHGLNDDVYVGDATGRIRKIDSITGIVTTIAGTGIHGYSGDGGPATEARIGAPSAIRLDGDQNLYFSDRDFHVVRKVDTSGTISTIIGTGEAGYSPDGTPAVEAMLHKPLGLEVSMSGDVYVADSRNNRIRQIDVNGKLVTVAGSDEGGDEGDGGSATDARLNEPHGLRIYGDDILLISDYYNNRIKAIKLALR
jgi:trimeric autotransporter adhesin